MKESCCQSILIDMNYKFECDGSSIRRNLTFSKVLLYKRRTFQRVSFPSKRSRSIVVAVCKCRANVSHKLFYAVVTSVDFLAGPCWKDGTRPKHQIHTRTRSRSGPPCLLLVWVLSPLTPKTHRTARNDTAPIRSFVRSSIQTRFNCNVV